ncbi:MAG: hypothetical protein LBF78_09790 [Treponema sp.]|jgi:hypothetical protein|nr:hypothetical protein [Treponema sp.]
MKKIFAIIAFAVIGMTAVVPRVQTQDIGVEMIMLTNPGMTRAQVLAMLQQGGECGITKRMPSRLKLPIPDTPYMPV